MFNFNIAIMFIRKSSHYSIKIIVKKSIKTATDIMTKPLLTIKSGSVFIFLEYVNIPLHFEINKLLYS